MTKKINLIVKNQSNLNEINILEIKNNSNYFLICHQIFC